MMMMRHPGRVGAVATAALHALVLLAIMTYEPLALTESATDEQRQLAAATKVMVDHFAGSRFAECIAAADCLEQISGPTKLTKLYRDACTRYLVEPPAQGFRGEITLTEK